MILIKKEKCFAVISYNSAAGSGAWSCTLQATIQNCASQHSFYVDHRFSHCCFDRNIMAAGIANIWDVYDAYA